MDLTVSEAVQSSAQWIMLGLTLVTVSLTVLIHFSCLNWLSQRLPKMSIVPRRRVLIIIVIALLAHVVEIWIFGGAYWIATRYPELGALSGDAHTHLLECVYFAAATFSTLGYGDIVPIGPLRLMAGLEALTGFVLITWTASFAYLEMQRNWSS